MSAKLSTLHVPSIAELKRGKRCNVRMIWKENWKNMGYGSESNPCKSRCIRNNSKETEAVLEWQGFRQE